MNVMANADTCIEELHYCIQMIQSDPVKAGCYLGTAWEAQSLLKERRTQSAERYLPMMLHKIFHMNQSVEETRRRLANISSYRHHLDGVEQADFAANNVSQWRLRLPLGFRADFKLVEAQADDNAVVFKSMDGGDLEIMGMVSFHAVTANLTEIDLVVNYESSSPLFNLLDRMLKVGDHFVVNQLRRVRAHFEGIATPVPHSMAVYNPELKAAAV